MIIKFLDKLLERYDTLKGRLSSYKAQDQSMLDKIKAWISTFVQYLFNVVKKIYPVIPAGLVANIVRTKIKESIVDKPMDFSFPHLTIEPESSPQQVTAIPEESYSKEYKEPMQVFKSIIGDTVVTSKFGYRVSTRSFHYGVDLRAKVGTPIYSPFDGVVLKTRTNTNDRGGRNVFIQSDDGIVMAFMHLSKVSVKPGQRITKGTLLGYTGQSGKGREDAYAPHLHLQVGRSSKGSIKWEDPLTFNYNMIHQPSNGRRASFKEDVKKSMHFFISFLSLTDFQASGILGNLIAESQLNPAAYNKSGGGQGAQGIAQWRGERINRYKSIYNAGSPSEDANLDRQLNYVIYELSHYYKSVLNSLKGSRSIEDATWIILSQYEKPGDLESQRSVRVQYAKEALSIYADSDILYSNVKYYKFQQTSHHSNARNQ